MMGDDEMIVDLGPKQLRCEIAFGYQFKCQLLPSGAPNR